MRDLDGRCVFITGGASGIGFGMAEAFVAAGAKVALADIDLQSARQAAERLNTAARSVAMAIEINVADRNAWTCAAEKAETALGPIDILCNNAGVRTYGKAIAEIPIEEWRWLMDINLFGVIHGIQCFVPRMKARGGGHIVNTASMAGMGPIASCGDYVASKYAVVGISESLRLELAPENIGVSALCPGYVRTSIRETTLHQRPTRASLPAYTSLFNPAAHYLEPRDVGGLVLMAILENRPFIFTNPEGQARVEARSEIIRDGFERLTAADGQHCD